MTKVPRTTRLAVVLGAALLGLSLWSGTVTASHGDTLCNAYSDGGPASDPNGLWVRKTANPPPAPVTLARALRADRDGDNIICQYHRDGVGDTSRVRDDDDVLD
jgi:hypothetical protein